jgi:hypothetical protein
MITPAAPPAPRPRLVAAATFGAAAATLAAACLREPPARPVVAPRAAAPAPAPAVSASAASKSRWVEGQEPMWEDVADCGVKEATYDVSWPSWRESPGFDISACAAYRGCPATTTAPMQWCGASTARVIDFDAFLDDPSLWRDGEEVRLRGRFFLHDPRRTSPVVVPTSAEAEKHQGTCTPGASSWTSSMQLLRGDRCYSVPLWGYFPSCAGDVSRSCCGNLPMGERIVVTAKLSVDRFPQATGQFFALAHVIEACRE